jgi:riboflavin transporter FmnP
MNNKNSLRNHINKLSLAGIISGISMVLVLPSFSVFPAASFLEYNPSDIPIVIASFTMGPLWGILISIVVSAIQALTISAKSGMYGFLMHVSATCIFAFVSGMIFASTKKKRKDIFNSDSIYATRLWISLIVGGILSALAMIPMNLIFVPLFMGGTYKDVVPMLTAAIIPFNMIKMALNCVGTGIVFTATKKVLNKAVA